MVDVLEVNEEKKEVRNAEVTETKTADKPEAKKTMDAKATGIISYLSIVGWIIAYMAGDKDGAKFHMNQALVLNISSLVLSILSRFGRPISYIVWIAEIGLSILWIIAFISAIKAEEKKVPLLGEIQILK